MCDQSTIVISECLCEPEYTFNPHYTSDANYCQKLIDKLISEGKIYKTLITYGNSENVEHNHIIRGIVIPICLVVICLSIIYGIKKLEVISSIRNLVTRKHRRPTYEDVVMGHDLDDPPLM